MASQAGGCLSALCVLQYMLVVLAATTVPPSTTTTTTKATTLPTTATTTTPPPTTTTTVPTTTEAPYTVKAYKDLKDRAPKRDDRIAIVGATMHGIHAALSLMDAGYIDVNVFESSRRVGGEGFSVYYNGQAFLLGETFIFDEDDIAGNINQRFQSTSLVPVPNPSIWINNTTKLSFMDYLLKVAKDVSPKASLTSANIVKHYQTLLSKYSTVVKSNFGEYNGHVMRRPLNNELPRLKKSFLKLLKDNKIEALKALFQTMLTSIGAGDIEDLPALYGCMFITRRMASVLSSKLGKGKPIASVFRKGIQHVLEEAVKMRGIDLKFDHEVNTIERSSKGYFTLYYRKEYVKASKSKKRKVSRGFFKRKFDHIFIAVEPYEFMRLIPDPSTEMMKILDPLETLTSYFQTYNLLRLNATNAGTRRHEQYAYRKHKDYNVHSCLDNAKPTWSAGSQTDKFTICLQESETSNLTLLAEPMYSHIEEMDYNLINPSSNTSVEDARKTYQRWEVEMFSKDAMAAGDLWTLMHNQGRDGLWVISRAASFPYADVTFDYTRRLLKSMGAI